jgi:hypothetical protein
MRRSIQFLVLTLTVAVVALLALPRGTPPIPESPPDPRVPVSGAVSISFPQHGSTVVLSSDMIQLARVRSAHSQFSVTRASVDDFVLPFSKHIAYTDFATRFRRDKNKPLEVPLSIPLSIFGIGPHTLTLDIQEKDLSYRISSSFVVQNEPLVTPAVNMMNVDPDIETASAFQATLNASTAPAETCTIPIMFVVPKLSDGSGNSPTQPDGWTKWPEVKFAAEKELHQLIYGKNPTLGTLYFYEKYPAKFVSVEHTIQSGWTDAAFGIVEKADGSPFGVALPELALLKGALEEVKNHLPELSEDDIEKLLAFLKAGTATITLMKEVKAQYPDVIPIILSDVLLGLNGDTDTASGGSYVPSLGVMLLPLSVGETRIFQFSEVGTYSKSEIIPAPIHIRLAHEIGHAMGLGHDYVDSSSLMFSAPTTPPYRLGQFQACRFRYTCLTPPENDQFYGVAENQAYGCGDGRLSVFEDGAEECEIGFQGSLDDVHFIDCPTTPTAPLIKENWPSDQNPGVWGYRFGDEELDYDTPYICYEEHPITGKECVVDKACGNGVTEWFEDCEVDEDCEGKFLVPVPDENEDAGVPYIVDIGRCYPPDPPSIISSGAHCICYADETVLERFKKSLEDNNSGSGNRGVKPEKCKSNTNPSGPFNPGRPWKDTLLDGQECTDNCDAPKICVTEEVSVGGEKKLTCYCKVPSTGGPDNPAPNTPQEGTPDNSQNGDEDGKVKNPHGMEF